MEIVMTIKDEQPCPYHAYKHERIHNKDITGDRMQSHGGVRRVPVCNHPDFPKPARRILAPLRCDGQVPEKCEVASFRVLFSEQ